MTALTVAAVYLFVLVTFGAYLAYCAIWEVKKTGALQAMSLPAKALVYNILVFAVILDVLFNWLIGSVVFFELPDTWLFTARCKKWKSNAGWRGHIARWVCAKLNLFQPGHC